LPQAVLPARRLSDLLKQRLIVKDSEAACQGEKAFKESPVPRFFPVSGRAGACAGEITADGKQGGISEGRGAGGKNALRTGYFWPPAGPREKPVPCFSPPAAVSRLYAFALPNLDRLHKKCWSGDREAFPKPRALAHSQLVSGQAPR
jgi:hypothetical protein